MRQQAREEGKWNLALAGLAEQVSETADANGKLQLKFQLAQLCCSAGQGEQALDLLAEMEAAVRSMVRAGFRGRAPPS